MYFIVAKNGTKTFYILENREYVVGRKGCDILITDDTSISRKHALLTIKKGKLHITDVGAKYNTFVNDVELKASVSTELNINDEIKFGILNSIYILKEQELNITTSGLTSEEKKVLLKVIKKLGGNLLEQWSKECTHLTVREILLTLKVLCALIERQPIVKQEYWTDFLKNISENMPPPDPNSYKPVYAENVLNKNINFSDEHCRKTLFSNKIFVFKNKFSKAKIDAIIELAGGKSICWDEKQVTSKSFLSKNPQYLLIQDDSEDSSMNTSFMKMISYLHTVGKRSIPFQEIAMAIVSASCEKDCNPDFDRTGMLMKGREEIIFTSKFLAPGTQTEDFENEEKPFLTVPETVKETPSMQIECSQNKHHDVVAMANKREGQPLSNEGKRIKLGNIDEKETYSNMFSDDSIKCKNIITSTQKYCNDKIDRKLLERPIATFSDTNEISCIPKQCSNENEQNLKRTAHVLPDANKKIKLDDKFMKPCQQKTNEEWISVDLTVEDKNMYVSKPILSNPGPSSSKQSNSLKKSENPFGFERLETKSKTSVSPKITEFFKKSPLASENSSDKTLKVLDSPMNIKRKSSDISSSTSMKERTLVRNPFSPKKRKTQESRNPFLQPSPKQNVPKDDNPFNLSSRKNGNTKNSNATPNQSTARDALTPYIFNVTVVDETIESTHKWLSKSTVTKDGVDVSKDKSHYDESMRQFFESFNNCVIVEKKSLIKERTLINNEYPALGERKNFKTFRKVQPLHIQTTIVPKARYRCTTNSEVAAY